MKMLFWRELLDQNILLTVDGPLFQRSVEILKSHNVLKDGNWLLDISEYGLGEKYHPYTGCNGCQLLLPI
jgi:hypothetical protein